MWDGEWVCAAALNPADLIPTHPQVPKDPKMGEKLMHMSAKLTGLEL